MSPKSLLPVAGPGRRQVLLAGALVAVGALCAELGSALSVTLFGGLDALAVASLRLVFGAAALGALARPRRIRRPAQEWAGVLAFGVAMAGTTLTLHAALERIPLGVAVTLQFLGPCAVALAKSRRPAELAVAVAALGGVALIAGPSGGFDPTGFALGIASGAFLGVYTLAAESVGKGGLEDLSIAVGVAALVALPFAAGHVGALTPRGVGVIAAAALLGVVIPYGADVRAAAASSSKVLGTLLAVDPVMGLAVGLVVLGQGIGPLEIAGVLVVAAAGAGIVALSGRRQAAR
jgi:inner membrane transporter RhtA